MPIVKLDANFIKHNLQCPTGQRKVEYCSDSIPGFMVTVSNVSPGKGTYMLRYKSSGQTKYVKIGRTHDISFADAKKKAKELKSEISLGSDPSQEKKDREAVPTFAEFMTGPYADHIRTRKITSDKDMEYYRLRLKSAFGHKRLNQISRREVQLFHTGLRDEGLAPATCNHYLKLMKRVLNLAIQWEIIDGPNPACGIQQYRELNLVENYMDDEQLQRLLTVLQTDKNRAVCSIVLFLLSTGARLNEALQAKWQFIDTDRRVWRIPATNSKSGKVRSVPLNDSALEVLSRQDTQDEFEYVFINRKTRKPYTTIQKVWNRLRNAADLEHVRIHDLRHQYASFLVNSGRTLYEVQQILGHSTSKVTQRYSHLTTATLQNASASAADRIRDAMKKSARHRPGGGGQGRPSADRSAPLSSFFPARGVRPRVPALFQTWRLYR